MKTETCQSCKTAFSYQPLMHEGRELFRPLYCPKCSGELLAKRDAEEKALRETELATKAKADWDAICPPLYQDTDPSRLPQESLRRVLAWQYGQKGLVVHGETGKGKTRAMFLLLRRLRFEDRKAIAAFDAVGFSHQCSKLFLKGGGEDWIDRLSTIDVVFLDDLAKCRLSERVDAELFGLIERRIANLKPVLVTTNTTGNTLESKLSPDRGAPLVRRLREFCETIQF